MWQLHDGNNPPSSLPSLGLSLHRHGRWVLVWFLVQLLENCVIPVVLYYGLRYATTWKPQLICTLITCIWGLLFYVEYSFRAWRLFFKSSTYQPLGSTQICARSQNHDNTTASAGAFSETDAATRPWITVFMPSRWYFDASHWVFSVTLGITLAEIIIAPIPTNPIIKLLAVVNPSVVLSICIAIFLCDAASLLKMRAHFRISSIAKGELVRPGLYTLLEDIGSVDLNESHAFRKKLDERWEASPEFRQLLTRISLFWSVPGLLVSAICFAVVFTTDTVVGFAVGWALPFLWAILWILVTMPFVSRGLDEQRQAWAKRYHGALRKSIAV